MGTFYYNANIPVHKFVTLKFQGSQICHLCSLDCITQSQICEPWLAKLLLHFVNADFYMILEKIWK